MASTEPVQEVKGCDHCNHPLHAGIKCRVCGRVTQPPRDHFRGVRKMVQEPVATMTVREDIIRMAREVGLKVCTNISGVTLVGAPLGDTPSIAHITIDEMARFTALVVAAERERNAKIADAHASCEGIAQVIAAEIRGQA